MAPPKRRFCPLGHDKDKVGRYGNKCAECERMRWRGELQRTPAPDQTVIEALEVGRVLMAQRARGEAPEDATGSAWSMDREEPTDSNEPGTRWCGIRARVGNVECDDDSDAIGDEEWA